MSPTDERPVTTSGFSKRDLVYLLYKRKGQILAVLLVSTLLTTIGVYLKSRSYEAFSSIFVERGAPPVTTGQGNAPRVVLERKELLNSEIDFMMSRAVLGKVADELLAPDPDAPKGPPREPPLFMKVLKTSIKALHSTLVGIGLIDNVGSREGLINALQSNVEAKPALLSNIITVSFETDSANDAMRVVNTLTRIYLQERLALLKRPGLVDFYQTQIDLSREQLEKIDGQVRELKQAGDVVSGDEQIRLKLEQIRDLDNDLKHAQSARGEFERKLETIRAQLADMPAKITSMTTLGPNPQLNELTAKLSELRNDRVRQAQVYKPGSQKVVNLDRSIEALERQIAKLDPTVTVAETVVDNDTRRGLEAAQRQAEVDFRSTAAREDVLRAQIEAARAELQRIDARTAELKELEDARLIAEKNYQRYIEAQEDARVTDATEVSMTNVDVIHYASLPDRPKRPRIIDILIGATLGLLLGIALAFAAEFFDHTLENKEDVEAGLGLPLLASLPDLAPERNPLLTVLLRLVGIGRRRA